MQFAFGANLELQGGQYGNAVLVKEGLGQARNVPLPTINQGEPRGVLVVSVDHLAARKTFHVLATHLDHRRDDTERWQSATQINLLAQQQPTVPTLLIGDLNATRDSRVLRRLSEMWSIAGGEPAPTIPAERPTRQIDFVLFRPQHAWRVVDVQVLDEAVASDHRPLLAVLRWRKAP